MTNKRAYEISRMGLAYPDKYLVDEDTVNEANEKVYNACLRADKYRWHDLRKNHKDLPIYEKPYLCVIETMGKFIYEQKKINKEYRILGRYQILDLKEFVIAWREIEPFDFE